jgi:acetyltransferase-like isoleucine patch superfamily enzyme
MSSAKNTEEDHELDEGNYIRSKLFGDDRSNLRRYADLVIGEDGSYWRLAKYELITFFFAGLRGALGLVLRKKIYPRLFKKVGRGVVFGRNLTIRNAQNISLGDNVIVDDDCVLDARGAGPQGVVIGDRVIINRGVSIQAKIGPIHIDDDTDIGMHCDIHSQGGVQIGRQVTIGGSTKISGGIFQIDRSDKQAADELSFESREQQRTTTGPIVIGDKCLIGMGSMFLDGVEIGEGCIVGAGSVNIRSAPPYAVVAGVPARVLRMRNVPS